MILVIGSALVQRNLCIVHQPAWLSVAELQKWYEAEKNEEQNAVNPVHYNYRYLSGVPYVSDTISENCLVSCFVIAETVSKTLTSWIS